MMYLTGDTHADWMSRLNTKAFSEQKTMTKNDFVVILGDFGIWDNSQKQKHDLDWLEDKPFTTLFIDGNHENFDILNNLPEQVWHGGIVHTVRPSVLHLTRGQVFTFRNDNRDIHIFTFGGASSHDIQEGILDRNNPNFKQQRKALDKKYYPYYAPYRINHESWWKEEMPSKKEMQTGLKTLKKYDNHVDYIFTHTPPASIGKQMGYCHEDKLALYLDKVKEHTYYKQWFFGHMHQNINIKREHAVGIYEQIVRLF